MSGLRRLREKGDKGLLLAAMLSDPVAVEATEGLDLPDEWKAKDLPLLAGLPYAVSELDLSAGPERSSFQLTTLNMGTCLKLTGAGFKDARYLSGIEELYADSCHALTDKGIAHFTRCSGATLRQALSDGNASYA